jgi:hypothetical protein
MTTSKPKMVTAVFRSHADADQAYDRLLGHGYTNREINVLMSDATRARYYPTEEKAPVHAGTAAAEGMGVGGAIGTAVGAAVGAIAAIGWTLTIPLTGGMALLVAGPIAAALAGAGAGAVTGGLIGALVGLGIPEPNARAYEEALRNGGVAMGVVPHSGEDTSWIKQTFTDLHGENICYC